MSRKPKAIRIAGKRGRASIGAIPPAPSMSAAAAAALFPGLPEQDRKALEEGAKDPVTTSGGFRLETVTRELSKRNADAVRESLRRITRARETQRSRDRLAAEARRSADHLAALELELGRALGRAVDLFSSECNDRDERGQAVLELLEGLRVAQVLAGHARPNVEELELELGRELLEGETDNGPTAEDSAP